MIAILRKFKHVLWRSVKLISILFIFLLLLFFLIRRRTCQLSNIVEPYVQKNDYHHSKEMPINYNSKEKNQVKNYPKYYEDNLHPKWTFKISRHYDDRLLQNWTEPPRIVIKSKFVQGENGTAFTPSNDNEKAEMEKLKNENNYNIYASERISLRRSLPDYRINECRNLAYPNKLPTVSVIIVFHNEAWSTLLRTVWSIIDRSPPELLKEIILVDDNSSWSFLKRPLDDYVDIFLVRVNIIRNSKREGLIRSRIIGAKIAKGSVLTFLDAHMECTEGWLQPALARIANDRSVVALPIIDGIESDDMNYAPADPIVINGLRLHLVFNWMKVPEREKRRTKYDQTAPLRTPTHVGCAFSIDREFFFEIGSYDEKMDIWGSENVEMAFRVWMCGGSLEVLPCSRIGHLYRVSTYSFEGDEEVIKARNNVRLVEVWMDEFKDLFYAANPWEKSISPGNLTERKNLRKQLNCKNFRWYLENVYPESTMLKEYISMGEIKSASNDICLDIGSTGLYENLVLHPCHGYGGAQFFGLATSGQIVTIEEICVGINGKSIILVECSDTDKTQLWDYNIENQWIVHRSDNLCMQNNGTNVILGACNSINKNVMWKISSTDSNNLPIDVIP